MNLKKKQGFSWKLPQILHYVTGTLPVINEMKE